ncbi:Hypothetical_protein [Hexamita inflata]|uniref:Hypothetical_protein n=1 Tax=Hexamita inflata TaxID=28002 RepID=A0AA86PHL5_9EUKA|nr:Hypothetical protein HINF_LOCUS23680 [Hexamita inflata]
MLTEIFFLSYIVELPHDWMLQPNTINTAISEHIPKERKQQRRYQPEVQPASGSAVLQEAVRAGPRSKRIRSRERVLAPNPGETPRRDGDRQAVGRKRKDRPRQEKTQTRQSGRCLKEASCQTRRKRSSSQSDQHYYITAIFENNNTEYHSLFQNISAQCFTSMSISSWCSFMYSMTLSCSFSWVHCMIGFRQIWSSRGCSKRSNSDLKILSLL